LVVDRVSFHGVQRIDIFQAPTRYMPQLSEATLLQYLYQVRVDTQILSDSGIAFFCLSGMYYNFFEEWPNQR